MNNEPSHTATILRGYVILVLSVYVMDVEPKFSLEEEGK